MTMGPKWCRPQSISQPRFEAAAMQFTRFSGALDSTTNTSKKRPNIISLSGRSIVPVVLPSNNSRAFAYTQIYINAFFVRNANICSQTTPGQGLTQSDGSDPKGRSRYRSSARCRASVAFEPNVSTHSSEAFWFALPPSGASTTGTCTRQNTQGDPGASRRVSDRPRAIYNHSRRYPPLGPPGR